MATSVESSPGSSNPLDLEMMDMDKRMLEVVEKIRFKEKEKLEMSYGVRIHVDALMLACNIVGRYPDAFLSSEGGDDCSTPNAVVLQKKAVELLDKACAKVRHDLDTNLEENHLDKAEYLLYRTIIELNEIKREKDRASQSWIPRVEEEYKGLKDLWGTFVGKWKPLVTLRQRSRRRAQEIYFMEQVRSRLVSLLLEVEAGKHVTFSRVVLNLNALLSQLLHTTHANFKQNVTVNPYTIAEVASSMTGVPASWLLNSSKPPLQGLGQRLAKRLVGQDHVINAITNALLRQRPHGSVRRPIGSFLFLCGASFGRVELIEALAEELFDSKDLLIRFDMSDYRDLHSSWCDSCFLGVRPRDYNHEEHGVGGKLIEAVKSRPFGVLLFENVDKANSYAIEILLDILRHGRLIDSRGSEVDFTNLLIIMTSDVGMNKFRSWGCNCLEKNRDQPMKKGLERHPIFLMDHECSFLPIYREANRRFNSELLQKLDDVVVFNGLSQLHCNVIARLQLRELTDAMRQEGLILYPSEAALRSMTYKSSCGKVGGGGLRIWLQENVVPMLYDMVSKNEINDIAIIYIDVLVGTNELSYRLEKSGSPVDLMVFEHFRESLNELRIMCRKEKERVNKIYTLKSKYFELITMDSDEDLAHVANVVQALVKTVDGLIANAIDVNFMCNKYRLASLNSLNEEAELRQREWADERARNGVEGLRTILDLTLGWMHQAAGGIAEALLRSIHAPHNPPHHLAKSFLLLGLTSAGKADLVRGLAELCAADQGAKMIPVNMEEHSEPDSFLRHMDGPFGYVNHEQHGLGLQEAIKMKPYRIVLIDQVEKAHMSVFSTLLLVLHHGTVRDSQGRIIDFSNTIVVIMSDLGNKEILAGLVGHACGGSVQRGRIKQGERHFRAELLNWVDEILIFNPFAQEQLGKFSRLSMRVGRHLEEGAQSALFTAFSHLFKEYNHPFVKKWPVGAQLAVSHLSKGIIGNSSNVVFANRSCFSPLYGGRDYMQPSSNLQYK